MKTKVLHKMPFSMIQSVVFPGLLAKLCLLVVKVTFIIQTKSKPYLIKNIVRVYIYNQLSWLLLVGSKPRLIDRDVVLFSDKYSVINYVSSTRS